MPRNTHALAILGPKLYSKLNQTRVLVVGAGGIGCELLKNIVLTGFGDITLLDLDTIDLSNLNRQFLFRKRDVKQSKAMVAAATARLFNPHCKITPIHANIKEEQYDVQWFKTFDIVLNALDNLDARRHVNKMCMAADVPLIESGTAGYLGQVQPIIKDTTECFDCMPKETPKTFPVCTIRATPSTPIHCIVWAKSYLLPQLFGEEEDESELDEAAAQGENAAEIANLRKEAHAFKSVRRALLSSPSEESAKMVFDKVFKDDIQRLLSMSDMWRSRKPPTPLPRQEILSGSFKLPEVQGNANTGNGAKSSKSNIVGPASNGANTAHGSTALRDQQNLTLRDSVVLFDDSLSRLAARLRSGKEVSISFDKDDDDTLDFVTATANLRAASYAIEGKTRWEVKEMAGNIIPAIATTNAVIAGLIVLQALQVLRSKFASSPSSTPSPTNGSDQARKVEWSLASLTKREGMRTVCLQVGKPHMPLGTFFMSPPTPLCGVCRDVYVSVPCDPARVTLGEILRAVKRAERSGDNGDGEREVIVYEGTRMLCDPDFDDNLDKSLESLGCTRGRFLTIQDEDGAYENVAISLSAMPDDASAQGPAFILPTPFPALKARKKPKVSPTIAVAAPAPPSSPPSVGSRKRSAPIDEDEDLDGEMPAAKRSKANDGSAVVPLKEDSNGYIVIEDDDDDDDMEIL
ncbi:E1 ubiquitin-activating protein uba2 [Tulasnella sp. JGI-2019a]|nr:E1 ubiquitin-activating protein uba2 [Tulasnella sp. JGI-2019a]